MGPQSGKKKGPRPMQHHAESTQNVLGAPPDAGRRTREVAGLARGVKPSRRVQWPHIHPVECGQELNLFHVVFSNPVSRGGVECASWQRDGVAAANTRMRPLQAEGVTAALRSRGTEPGSPVHHGDAVAAPIVVPVHVIPVASHEHTGTDLGGAVPKARAWGVWGGGRWSNSLTRAGCAR